MTLRLLLDEMYPAALAQDLRMDHDHDVLAVVESEELRGCDDAFLFRFAAAQRRCLVTENVCDFAVLARRGSHAGLLLVHGRRWPRRPTAIPKLGAALHEAIKTGQVPGPDEVRWLT